MVYLGLLNGLSKVKRTDKVIDDFDFLYLVGSPAPFLAGSFRYKDFVNKLPQYGCVKLGQAGILLCRSNKVLNIGFALFLLLDFLTQYFGRSL